ncbi:MAG: glycosyltransferase [Opitutus sp.]
MPSFAVHPTTMSSFRILHVIFSSRLAGSERYCVDLANRQAESGHEVHVAGRRNSAVAEELDPRVTYHAITPPFLRHLSLRRLVRAWSIDVCHGHLSAACKALGRLRQDCATVATLHVGYKAHQHSRLDALVCVNRAQSNRLAEYSGIVRTVPNWLPRTGREIAPADLRRELGLAEDTFVVGAVGRLHRSKGADVLIKAFRQTASARSALVIVGEGPHLAELKELSGDDLRIHLLGFRSNVQTCLQGFDLFVSPSREESFGLAILEAMAAGLPVIATNAEGPAEYLKDHPIALVDIDSVDGLAAALDDAQRQHTEGRLSRVSYDLSQFEPAHGIASIDEIYIQALKARSRIPRAQPRGTLVAQ